MASQDRTGRAARRYGCLHRTTRVVHTPRPRLSNATGSPPGPPCSRGDPPIWFFKGPNYVPWDATDNTVGSVNAIADGWPALPATFAAGMDAAINWGDGFAFFFKGPKFVKYDIAADTVDATLYPRNISAGWPALPAGFMQGINAAVNWGTGFSSVMDGGPANFILQDGSFPPVAMRPRPGPARRMTTSAKTAADLNDLYLLPPRRT
jgi:hypothetical protein